MEKQAPEKMSEKKKFSVVARARSFNHAFRGLRIIFKTQHNSWIHILGGFVVVILGLVFNISHVEWLVLVLAISSVLAAEAFNTAIEIDIDLTSPDYHPYAKDTKDVAAAAVLITATGAIIVGLVIFLPKIFL